MTDTNKEREALRTIAAWPITDPGNMDAVNMAAVAREAFAAPAQAPAPDYDHGPQSATVEEAARHVGKWLNERPNRPLDLRDVAMLVAHAQAPAPGWVSVDERLPEAYVGVPVAIDAKYVTTGEYMHALSCFTWDEHDDETDESKVTHWMPLPAAPSSGKGG